MWMYGGMKMITAVLYIFICISMFNYCYMIIFMLLQFYPEVCGHFTFMNEVELLSVASFHINVAYHVHLHLHVHWKLCHYLRVAIVPIRIVCCPRRVRCK